MSKNQKGKGLGRGIDALFMNDLDTLDALEQVQETEQIQQIAVSEIRPNPYQPRKEFDEEGLAELAESIRQNGVFQPMRMGNTKPTATKWTMEAIGRRQPTTSIRTTTYSRQYGSPALLGRTT